MIPAPKWKVRRWRGGVDTLHVATSQPLWDVIDPDGERVATHETHRAATFDAHRRARKAAWAELVALGMAVAR